MSDAYTMIGLFKGLYKMLAKFADYDTPHVEVDEVETVFPLHSNVLDTRTVPSGFGSYVAKRDEFINSLRFSESPLDYTGGGQQSSALIKLMVGIQDELDKRLDRVEAALTDEGQLAYVTDNGMMIGYPTEGSETWPV